MLTINFLTSNDEEEIVEAIRVAECDTSGEIRVHIEQNCDIDVYERALDVFHFLKMDNTKEQNGVLIYVAVTNKSFVIFGDQGINNVIDSNFWNTRYLSCYLRLKTETLFVQFEFLDNSGFEKFITCLHIRQIQIRTYI